MENWGELSPITIKPENSNAYARKKSQSQKGINANCL